ncbi:MAG TPA: nitroreductase family protein [Candidatus Acidoferrales bacterium]|jgi:nitroreductase|nr:nitroreductase family protein [Candidatus Acidoferrales bacterium]
MEKFAETQVPIHDLIGRRWSPRTFSEHPVERDKLVSVFEAARWAASASNEQPWAFLVATREDSKNYADLLSVLVEFNRSWARTAPVLILTVAHTHFEKDGRPNRHGYYDLGQAVENLSLQATALGLTTHQMAGFDAAAARTLFAIPAGWDAVSAIALGYPGPLHSLPENLQQRETAPRRRKALETFVFSGAWANPAPLTCPAETK